MAVTLGYHGCTTNDDGCYVGTKIIIFPGLLVLTLTYHGCTASDAGSYVGTEIIIFPAPLVLTLTYQGCTAKGAGSYIGLEIIILPASLCQGHSHPALSVPSKVWLTAQHQTLLLPEDGDLLSGVLAVAARRGIPVGILSKCQWRASQRTELIDSWQRPRVGLTMSDGCVDKVRKIGRASCRERV